MKKIIIALLLLVSVFTFTSCDAISFEPYNVLPGTYIHKITGASVTDLMIEFRDDGTCHYVEYDGYIKVMDLETKYSSKYINFSYELIRGTVKIEDVGTFEFRWYSDRDKFQKMELIDTEEKKKYTMVYGEVNEG